MGRSVSGDGRSKSRFLSFFRPIIRRREAYQEEVKQELFTEQAWESISSSAKLAKENGQVPETEHLMKVLLDQCHYDLSWLFAEAGFLYLDQLANAVDVFISSQTHTSPVSPGSTHGLYLQQLIQRAIKYKKRFRHSSISVHHLVLALSLDERLGKQLFTQFQISPKALRRAFDLEQDIDTTCKSLGEHSNSAVKSGNTKAYRVAKYGKHLTFLKTGGLKNSGALEKFGECITSMAKERKLDHVIGMENDIRRCMSVLSCRRTMSHILIGEAGKSTDIVKGLALRIVEGDVHPDLMNCEVMSLSMGALIANTNKPGEYEDRIEAVLNEVSNSDGQIILYIDDVRIFVDPGAILEHISDHGKVRCMAALRHIVGSHKPVRCIVATTLDDYHRYIEQDSFLMLHFRKVYVHRTSETLGSRSDDCVTSPSPLISIEAGSKDSIENVSTSSAPVSNVFSKEINPLKFREEMLKYLLINQGLAIRSVVDTVQRLSLGDLGADRPKASFMVTGSLGLGYAQRHLALGLASYLFNSEKALTCIDLNHVRTSEELLKVVGTLIKADGKSPIGVIMFDGIRCMNSDVFDVFRKICREGVVIDLQGRSVSFRDSVVVLEPYHVELPMLELDPDGETVEQWVNKAAKCVVFPELVDIVDEVIPLVPVLDGNPCGYFLYTQWKQMMVGKRVEVENCNLKIDICSFAVRYLGFLFFCEFYRRKGKDAVELAKELIEKYVVEKITAKVIEGRYDHDNDYVYVGLDDVRARDPSLQQIALYRLKK